MKQLKVFIGLLFILLTIQCSLKKNSERSHDETVQEADNQNKRRNVTITVKDSTQYSKEFLAGLRVYGPGRKFELTNDDIVIDGHRKMKIIQLIPQNETVELHGLKNGKKYDLKLQRINYTSISYEFDFTDENGKLFNEQGIGEIRADFMLGSGMDEDDNGLGYGISSEYWTNDSLKHLVSIRIGVVDEKIVGRIDGKKKDFSLEQAPFLRSQKKPAFIQ